MNMPKRMPRQHQERQPGQQAAMHPEPLTIRDDYRGADKLRGKLALISGGDSGIGRAVAVHFAREGADVAIVHLDSEIDDALATRHRVEAEGRRCMTLAADLGAPDAARRVVDAVVRQFGRLDVLVNNAGEQHPQPALADITPDQLERTFRTNLFAMLYLTQAALPHLPRGGAIINTGSVTGARGNPALVDYSATKGAIQAFTFSLASQLAPRGIRVNAVAPGPIWTPLIPSTFTPEKVETFGQDTLLKRPGQPAEVAPAYVYLACDDASYVTGQILHINGGSLMSP
ncbi:SDR family oxidoreductase [Solimonas soli]|uniref:SDR family oxidoreductase n=1 Tax=Solimonas soli TaxID=413479 RepID=UPI0004805AC7|nr:SDR family oxidoreductase [Solimonas soli]